MGVADPSHREPRELAGMEVVELGRGAGLASTGQAGHAPAVAILHRVMFGCRRRSRGAVRALVPDGARLRLRPHRARIAVLRADSPTLVANFLFQRVLRVNSDVSWSVHYTSRVVGHDRISLGRGVRRSFAVSAGCYFQAVNGISIGDDTLIGPGVKIISANHSRTDLGAHVRGSPVVIGTNCWIGANAVVLPGVRLGNGVTVGAGAVVTRSFPDGAVVVGNPARQIAAK